MQAQIITCHDPFRPSINREVKVVTRKRRIDKLAPKTDKPFICVLNGEPLLRHKKGWQRSVRDGDTVAFVILPHGGGGGSNPLKIILAITVAVIAPQIGFQMASAMGTSLGGFASTAAFGEFLGAAVGFGLNAVINALIPQPQPPKAQKLAELAAPSPTYALNAQGNVARLGQPIPVVYGRNVIYPDFIGQPYTEYAGNEQYLYQLFCIGHGQFDIEQIRIEDTIVENDVNQTGAYVTASGAFEEIEYQVIHNAIVTAFPANVFTATEVSGQELIGDSATYSQSGTTITVTKADHGLTAGELIAFTVSTGSATSGDYLIATIVDSSHFTITSATSASTSGSATVGLFVGSFVVNPAGSLINAIAVDVVTPKGLYYANDAGGLNQRTVAFKAEARQIDDSGSPIGGWATIVDTSFTEKTTTPQRRSYKAGVADGRYEVRMTRTNSKDTNVRAGNDVNWGTLRGYSRGTQNYGDVTVIAMRMRATNNLSAQASRKINVIATRMLPIWNGSTWSDATQTRSIAWAIADLCKASYGMKLSDSQVDLNSLLALDAIWSSRLDYFDGVFDSQQPAWEAVSQIARCGRALPYMQGGIFSVARDSEETIPTAMFSQRNIARNSMNLQYIMPSDETADALDIEYWDHGTWQPKTVRAALPDSDELVVSNIKLFGCTDRDQAWREGMYMAACNRYRRRTLNFETEMEGFIPSIGDLIAIQHDMPQWGLSGDVTSWDAGTLTLGLSEPVTLSGTSYIALRRRNGSVSGPYLIASSPDQYTVVLTEMPDITPDFGINRERTHFAFGLADAMYITARVLSIKPRSLNKVAVYAVVESDYVHNADTGAAPSDDAWQLPTINTMPVIAGLLGRSDPSDVDKMFLSWQPAAGAEYYLIEVSDSGEGWTRIGETRTSNYTAIAPYGNRTQVRVCGVGAVKGPWVEISYGSSASYMWNSIDTTLMWNADDTILMWRY